MPATLQLLGEQMPLDNTMGVMFIGTLISAILYGASMVQTVYYYVQYPKDKPIFKWLVFLTVSFDTIHMAFITHTIYHYLVTSYYDTTALNHLIWSVIAEAIPNGFVGALVQAFYVWRVYLMTANKILTFFISVLVCGTAGCGVAWAILALRMDTYSDLLALTPLTITINVMTMIVDVLIAGSLVWALLQSRSKLRQTNAVISRLILFFINTGLATSICAIATMIALAARPDTLVYASFYFCIGRLYTNSLLASLNSRKSLRNTSARSGGIGGGGAGGGGEGHNMISFPALSTNPLENIIITTTTTTTKDIGGGGGGGHGHGANVGGGGKRVPVTRDVDRDMDKDMDMDIMDDITVVEKLASKNPKNHRTGAADNSGTNRAISFKASPMATIVDCDTKDEW